MLLIESFRKLGWDQMHTIAYDILQYIGTVLVVLFFLWQLNSMAAPIAEVRGTVEQVNAYIAGNATLPPLTDDLAGAMRQQESMITGFVAKLVLLAVFSAAALLALSGTFRTLVYRRLKGQKAPLFRTLFITNTLWLTGWSVVVVITFVSLQLRYASVIFFVECALYLHLSAVIRSTMTRKDSVGAALLRGLSTGIRKAYRFLVPVGLILLALFILTSVSYLGRVLNHSVVVFIAFIVMFVFISWARTYYCLVAEDVA